MKVVSDSDRTKIKNADAAIAQLVAKMDALSHCVCFRCKANTPERFPHAGVVRPWEEHLSQGNVGEFREHGLHPVDGRIITDELAFCAGENKGRAAGEFVHAEFVFAVFEIVYRKQFLTKLDFERVGIAVAEAGHE